MPNSRFHGWEDLGVEELKGLFLVLFIPGSAGGNYAIPVINEDRSVDLYFGLMPPAGKEKNWIETVPGKGRIGIFRL